MITTEELNIGYYKADTATQQRLAHPVNVVFLGHTAALPLEFSSGQIAMHIADLLSDQQDAVFVDIFPNDVSSNANLLYLSKKIAETAEKKPLLVLIHHYDGAKSFTAVRDFLNVRYHAIHYEVTLIQREGECVDLFYSDVIEIEPNDSRIDAFKVAMDIFENNDPRQRQKDTLDSMPLPLCAIKKLALQALVQP